jgi:hypothetical protein
MKNLIEIDCKEIKKILENKLKQEQVKEEGSIKYYNFPIIDIIPKFNKDNYSDFGIGKVISAYFDLVESSTKLTLDDFNKSNKILSDLEKTVNDLVSTKGVFYFSRVEDSFNLMYYEVIN